MVIVDDYKENLVLVNRAFCGKHMNVKSVTISDNNERGKETANSLKTCFKVFLSFLC